MWSDISFQPSIVNVLPVTDISLVSMEPYCHIIIGSVIIGAELPSQEIQLWVIYVSLQFICWKPSVQGKESLQQIIKIRLLNWV